MRISTLLLAPSLVFVAAPLPPAGDILCLKDGRVVEGRPMERKPGGVELSYEHGKIFIPDAMILDAVLASDSAKPPVTDEEKDMSQKGMVRFENKWISAKQRDEILTKRIEERRKELKAIEDRHEWRNRATQDTAHFHFEFTVPDHIFENYRDLMEAYFTEFAKTWKLKPPGKEDRLNVSFHADEATFHQVSGAPPNALGYFRYIKPWDLNIFYERLDPDFTTEVMFHESNHYLQQLIDTSFAVPHFPGESLAEYYGASHWDPEKKKLTTGLILEGRLCEVQEDIDKGEMQGLGELVSAEDSVTQYKHYTWGWTLVHFLMSDARYQPKFQKFVFTLARGKGVRREQQTGTLTTVKGDEVLRVFMDELGLKDAAALLKLEQEWHAYVKKLKPATLSGIEKAGMSAAEHRRPLRAMRLFKDAIAKGSKNALVYHRNAQLLASKGKRGEAEESWKKALELDPLNGEFYWYMGNSLYRGQQQGAGHDESVRLIGLAKDLGFESIWIDDTDLGKGDDKN